MSNNYAKKQRVNVAVSKNNPFNLTKKVITTNDFGRIKPIECRYMVPGDKFNYKVSSFTRMLPMSAPTFGKIEQIQRAFFVPIRTIMPDFNEFISGNHVFYDGAEYTPQSPVIILSSLYKLFTKSKYSTRSATQPKVYDFYLSAVEGSWQAGYYTFTLEGRKSYDFLLSLGLNVPFNSGYSGSVVSALPLLAYWKSYIDWVVPSRFIKDIDNIHSVINCIHPWNTSGSSVFHYGDNVVLSDNTIEKFVQFAIPYFSNDFFTSAWESPYVDSSKDTLPMIKTENGVYVGTKTDNATPDQSTQFNTGARVMAGSGADQNIHNYITIETLGRLQDYLNRGLLAGSKIQDWLLEEFGMRPSTDALQLSTYLGSNKNVIRIGDVMSNADTFEETASGTKGSQLGQYAGKAIGDSVDTFSYESKEHGFFIITSEFIPETSYYQGLTPEFMLNDRLSFFQPEFDNLGVEAIARKQLYYDSKKQESFSPDAIFGFTPRYSSLKTSFDIISGNFRLPTMEESLKPWWLARDMRNNIQTAWINDEFAKLSPNLYNYDYIFNYQSPDVDHFYTIYLLENKASRPMLSLEDAFNPEHSNGNKEVTLNANGNIANN